MSHHSGNNDFLGEEFPQWTLPYLVGGFPVLLFCILVAVYIIVVVWKWKSLSDGEAGHQATNVRNTRFYHERLMPPTPLLKVCNATANKGHHLNAGQEGDSGTGIGGSASPSATISVADGVVCASGV